MSTSVDDAKRKLTDNVTILKDIDEHTKSLQNWVMWVLILLIFCTLMTTIVFGMNLYMMFR